MYSCPRLIQILFSADSFELCVFFHCHILTMKFLEFCSVLKRSKFELRGFHRPQIFSSCSLSVLLAALFSIRLGARWREIVAKFEAHVYAPCTPDAMREVKQIRKNPLWQQNCSHCRQQATHQATNNRMGPGSVFWRCVASRVQCAWGLNKTKRSQCAFASFLGWLWLPHHSLTTRFVNLWPHDLDGNSHWPLRVRMAAAQSVWNQATIEWKKQEAKNNDGGWVFGEFSFRVVLLCQSSEASRSNPVVGHLLNVFHPA